MKSFGKKYLVPVLIAASIISGSYLPGKTKQAHAQPTSITQTYEGIRLSPEKNYSEEQIKAYNLATNIDSAEYDLAPQTKYVQEQPVVNETPKQTSQTCDDVHYRHPGRNGYKVSDGPTYTDSKGEYFFVDENDIAKVYEQISEDNPNTKEVYFEVDGESLNRDNLEGVLKTKDACYKVPIINKIASFKNIPKNLTDYMVAIDSGNERLASYQDFDKLSKKNSTYRGGASSNGSSVLPPTQDQTKGSQNQNGNNGTGSTGQGSTQDISKFPIYCAENCTAPIQPLSSSYGKTKANVGDWVVLKPVNPDHKIIREDPMNYDGIEHSKAGNSVVLRAHQPEKASVRIEYSDSGKLKSATVGLEFLINSGYPGEPTITEDNLTNNKSNSNTHFNGKVHTYRFPVLSKKSKDWTAIIQEEYAKGNLSTLLVNQNQGFSIDATGGTPYLWEINNPKVAAQIKAGTIKLNEINPKDFSKVRLFQISKNHYEINQEGETSLENKIENASWGTGKYVKAMGDFLNDSIIRMPYYAQETGVQKDKKNSYIYAIVGRDANGNLDINSLLLIEAGARPVIEWGKGFGAGFVAGAGASTVVSIATSPTKVITIKQALEMIVSLEPAETIPTITGGNLLIPK
ncbi:MAG: hypothetical protein WC413_00835 [Candidatus Nanoarchaeia archaeon]